MSVGHRIGLSGEYDHSWDVLADEALKIQERLAFAVRMDRPESPIRLVAGADCSYSIGGTGCAAGIAVWDLESCSVVETQTALADLRGSRVNLVDRGEAIGTVLRTRTGVRPLYVSVGHRIDLATADRIVLACTGRYRLPEPLRVAHRLATEALSSMPGSTHP